MMKLAKRLLKKSNGPVTACLRNFPWPIRKCIRELEVVRCSEYSHCRVVVLCRQDRILEGCWALMSWMTHYGELCGATLLVDGKIDESDRSLFNSLFVGGQMLVLDDLIRNHRKMEEVDRFVEGNWTARKLIALLVLQEESTVLYCDDDVIAFQKCEEVWDALMTRDKALFLKDPDGYIMDPWFSDFAREQGIEVDEFFNAGLLLIPQKAFDLDFVRSTLERWDAACNSHHAEQTFMSVLMMKAGGRAMNSARHALSWRGACWWESDLSISNIASRHYTGPVRHRMYMTAYPWLIRRVRSKQK